MWFLIFFLAILVKQSGVIICHSQRLHLRLLNRWRCVEIITVLKSRFIFSLRWLITFPRCCLLPGVTGVQRKLCFPPEHRQSFEMERGSWKVALATPLKRNGVSLCLTTWLNLICLIPTSSNQWSNQKVLLMKLKGVQEGCYELRAPIMRLRDFCLPGKNNSVQMSGLHISQMTIRIMNWN